jgi:aminoglycoside 2''-phosphotransferase
MDPLPAAYVNLDRAKGIVGQLFPRATSVVVVDRGYDNLVIIIDGLYAVRFPRNENAYLRSQYEKLVLEQLGDFQAVTIPKVIGSHAEPPYLMTSFVSGVHLTSQEIDDFPPTLQQQLGEDVAQFAYHMHTAFSVEEALEMRRRLKLDELTEEPWDMHMRKTLSDYTFPTAVQDAVAKEYYDKWRKLTGPLVVVHDDLHTDNMLFEDNRLHGILDFGDTNIGIPEQELRQLYRINAAVMQAAADSYSRLSGKTMDVEATKIWAIAQELAVYSGHLSTNQTEHHAFARACRNLNRWLPEGRWGAGLIDPHNPSIRQ